MIFHRRFLKVRTIFSNYDGIFDMSIINTKTKRNEYAKKFSTNYSICASQKEMSQWNHQIMTLENQKPKIINKYQYFRIEIFLKIASHKEVKLKQDTLYNWKVSNKRWNSLRAYWIHAGPENAPSKFQDNQSFNFCEAFEKIQKHGCLPTTEHSFENQLF